MEKLKLIKWADDGFPPIDLNENYAHVIALITELKKKTRKKNDAVDECYSAFVEAWSNSYPKLMVGFNSLHGKKIKELIDLTKAHIIGSNKIPTKDLTVNTWKYFLDYAKRENHFLNGKPLTTWITQYSSMINEAYNGKSRQQNQRNRIELTNDFIRAIPD